MKLILLSGGSGKRLWPLSNNTRSKQFLKVLKKQTGQLESMVQRVWRQLSDAGLFRSSFIATGAGQVDMLQSQLGPDVPLIIEPKRRDTFPAIALAATYLHSLAHASREETVAVLPVDPYVETDFFHKITELERVLEMSEAELALMGVEPTYPAEKYGYIVPNQAISTNDYQLVRHFVEKPSEARAKELMASGALWNCGVFAFRLGFLLDLLKQNGWPVQYEELYRRYEELPKISFDYQVVEQVKRIAVLPYFGEWKDLGTWNTLTEEMGEHLIGPGIIDFAARNVHVVNELGTPVTVLGLSDVVVAASPDGILVADKAASPSIKNIMKDIDTSRPMYEERRWGWYRVLDYEKAANGQQVLTKRIGIASGKNLSYQVHHKRSEIWTVIRGEGQFVLDDRMYNVKSGDVLQIPVGAKHAIRAMTELEFIEVQMGSELIEEDIIRLCMTWNEIEEICMRAEGVTS